jgi:hypothetical protein
MVAVQRQGKQMLVISSVINYRDLYLYLEKGNGEIDHELVTL